MRLVTAAAASLAFGAMTAAAGPVTPGEVERVLEDYGAVLNSSSQVSDTAHVINADLGDLSVYLRLMECNAASQCGMVVMFTAFGIEEEIGEETLLRTNRYNDSYPIGRAFVFPDEDGGGNLVGIDYVIDVSSEAVIDAGDLERFEGAVDAYVDHWTSSQGQSQDEAED